MGAKLSYLARDCEECELCDIATPGSVLIPPRPKTGHVKMLLVGEAPGPDEDRNNAVFIGRAGDLLDRLLDEAGIPEEDVGVTNAVRCWAGRDKRNRINKPKKVHFEACRPYLLEELHHRKPEVVVALGGSAAQQVMGSKKSVAVGKHRGARLTAHVSEFEGSPAFDVPIVVTYHPAYVLRDHPEIAPLIVQDMKYAAGVYDKAVDAGYAKRADTYRLIQTRKGLKKAIDYILSLHEGGKLPYGALGIDTETTGLKAWDPKGRILSIQIAWGRGKAFLVPVLHRKFKDHEFDSVDGVAFLRKQLRRLLEAKVPVRGQNFKFDVRWFWAKLGLDFTKVFDGDSELIHHCIHGPTRPRSLDYQATTYLKVEPYKREFQGALSNHDFEAVEIEDLVLYGCGDAEYCLRLHAIHEKELRRLGRWDVYRERYVAPWRVLAKAELHGVGLDRERLEELEPHYTGLMTQATETVKRSKAFRKWRRMSRKENPKRFRTVCAYQYQFRCRGCRHYVPWKTSPHAPRICPKCSASKDRFERRRKTVSEEVIEQTDQPKWLYPETINLKSSQQVQRMLYRILRLPQYQLRIQEYKDKRTGETKRRKPKPDDSTEAKRLRELGEWAHACAKGQRPPNTINIRIDPGRANAAVKFIRETLRYRRAETLLTRYVRGMPKEVHSWGEESLEPTAQFERRDPPGTLHTVFSQAAVRTGRLSAADPPLHQAPKDTPFREALVPIIDGLCLRSDYGQMELVVVACVSGDKSLQAILTGRDPRFSEYGGDVHTYVACMVYKKSITYVEEHSYLRRRAKAVSFGILYGRGAAAIALDNDLTLKEAEDLIRMYFGLFPDLAGWIESQHELVARQGGVFTPSGRWCPIPNGLLGQKANLKWEERRDFEEACRQVVNFPIQGEASDVGLLAATRIDRELESRRMRSVMYAFIHDSLDYDLHTPELFNLYEICQRQMLNHGLPWLTVPLRVDTELGVDWLRILKIKKVQGNIITMKGDAEVWPLVRAPLREAFSVRQKVTSLGVRKQEGTSEAGLALEDIELRPDYEEVEVKVELTRRVVAQVA